MDSMYRIIHFLIFSLAVSITWIFVEIYPLCIKFQIYWYKVVHSSSLLPFLYLSIRFIVMFPFFIPVFGYLWILSFYFHQSCQGFNFFISLFKELHFAFGPLYFNVCLFLSLFFFSLSLFCCSWFSFLKEKEMLTSLIFNLFYCMHTRL